MPAYHVGLAKADPLSYSDYYNDVSKHKQHHKEPIDDPHKFNTSNEYGYKEYDGGTYSVDEKGYYKENTKPGNYYKFVYNQEPILFQNYCNVENLRYTLYPGLEKYTHNISETHDDYTHLRVLIKYDNCELECMFDKQNIDSGLFEFIIYNIKNKDEPQLRKFVEDDYNKYNNYNIKYNNKIKEKLKEKQLFNRIGTGLSKIRRLFVTQAPTPTPTPTEADLLNQTVKDQEEVNEINPILKASSGIYKKTYEDGTTNYIIQFRNVLSNEPKKEKTEKLKKFLTEKEKLINYLTDKYKFDYYTPFFENATIEIVKEDQRNQDYIKNILFKRDDFGAWMTNYEEQNTTTALCNEKKFNDNESEVCDDGDFMKTMVDNKYTGITTKTTYNKESIIKKKEKIYPISKYDNKIKIEIIKYDENGKEKTNRTYKKLPDGTIDYDTGELKSIDYRGGRKSKRRNSKRNRRSSNKKRSSRRK